MRVAIVGATGYAGVESYRLLLGHPEARVTYLASSSQSGTPIGRVYPHLGPAGQVVLRPVDAAAIAEAADIALLAVPARQALELAPALCAKGVRVVDFGADFRLKDAEAYAQYYGGPHTASDWLAQAVYGLTEFHRAEIGPARLVANPGCYPTAALFALWPALADGLCDPSDVVIDCKSGVSGAGRQPTQTGHLPEADDNVWPYKLAGAHRHTPEIEQELSVAARRPVRVTFSPHQVPMARGLLATCYARLTRPVTQAQADALFGDAYGAEPFVQFLTEGLPATKATLGSNLVQVAVRIDDRVGRLVAVAAIDNLGKGAAGQAVQNLNRMFGLEETLGLPRIGLMP